MNGSIAQSRDSVVESPGHLNKDYMNYDSFSHGQIQSKVWLCEELEQYISEQQTVFILGGWHNILGFMLLTRRPDHYASVVNIDLDAYAVAVADKICDE